MRRTVTKLRDVRSIVKFRVLQKPRNGNLCHLGLLAISATSVFAIYSATALAQSAPEPNSTCVQPPGPAALIVPTHIFKPITPSHGTPTMVNPLRQNTSSPLKMLTLGDSAMWGNGLRYWNKYSYKVAQDVANATGRTVNLVSFAHSGANLSNEANSDYEPLMPSDGGTPPGDLNAGLPTTIQQEACAHTDPCSSDAEIILLDGCINEVGAQRIALPFSLSGATVREIAQRSHQWCSDKMLALLQSTKSDFPGATIVVSNYWLIVSDKSSPIGVAQERAAQQDMLSLVEAERKAEQATGQSVTESRLFSDPKTLLQKWSDNSKVFLKTSQGCFEWAIAYANGTTSAPNGSDGTGDDDQCPAVPPAQPQRATKDFRVYLATVSDDSNYSYGAPKKRLWSVPVPIIRPDELYTKRSILCKTHYSPSDIGDRFICPINPTAHPNVRGAEAFCESITHILEFAWKST
jgi:hypothetical protein